MKLSSKLFISISLAVVLSACATTSKPEKPAKPAMVAKTPDSPASTPATGSKPKAKPKTDAATPDAAPIVPAATPEAQFQQGLAALKEKDLKGARTVFELLAKEHPELSGPLTNLGILDAKANAREAAITAFSRATVANPQNATAYNWLGALYRDAKDYTRAEQAYARALAIRPDYPATILNLAILHDVYQRRPGEALALYRRYQELSGNKELKVTAWIKALEAEGVAVPTAPVILPKASAKAKS